MIKTRSPLRTFFICAVAGTAVVCLSAAADPGHPQPLREGPAEAPARLADGRVTRPLRVDAVAKTRCPRASYGPHFYAPGRRRTVALSFDDGPGRSTARILLILRKYRVPATFFNIGENEAVRRKLVLEEYKDGFALGNHTWNHPDMTRLSASEQAAEMDRTIAETRSIARVAPCAYRPPYGTYNATTLRLAQHRRMAVWLWSVDTEDWKADGSGSSFWVHRIIRLAEAEGRALSHPVVLMHNQPDGNPATVSALPRIIHFFRVHDYRFVKL
jgi:peptidoglycan/xylan/chitin deacetylase (PgdA/CDA1 family)